MILVRTVLIASGLLLTVCGGTAVSQSGAPASGGTAASNPSLTLQMPPLPDPVRVVLKPATTALLVFDMVDPICTSQPRCMSGMLPKLASFMAQARKVGVPVFYGTRAPTLSKWLPEVAPAPGDTVFASYAQDRFYNTDLDKMLKAKGITTLILTGWKISGSVTYTSVGATLRDYTVVVPVDTSSAITDYEVAIGQFQILTQASANATNEPLKPKTSTLSRTDMMAFD